MTLIDQLNQLVLEIKAKTQFQKKPFLIAIDGRSGSGKSTIAKKLAYELDALVITSDDFCSSIQEWGGKTPEEKVAFCIDWKRQRREVLEPLLQKKSASYFPFDFERSFDLSEKAITLNPKKILILDGAYSARPELRDLIDIKILVQCDDAKRRERLLKREGEKFMKSWHAIWDVAEDYYFKKYAQPEMFDFIINIP